jgi:hypothetical protein
MKTLVLTAGVLLCSAGIFAQTERIIHESLGGSRLNFRTNGPGNFGQVPMYKILNDSLMIDSIMKEMEKPKSDPIDKKTNPKPVGHKGKTPSKPLQKKATATVPEVPRRK